MLSLSLLLSFMEDHRRTTEIEEEDEEDNYFVEVLILVMGMMQPGENHLSMSHLIKKR